MVTLQELVKLKDANGNNYFPGAICNGVGQFSDYKNGIVREVGHDGYKIVFGDVAYLPTSQFEIIGFTETPKHLEKISLAYA